MTEHAILVLAKYRRILVSHPDGTSVRLNYDVTEGAEDKSGWSYFRPAYKQRHLQENQEYNKEEYQAWRSKATLTEERGWEAAWYDSNGLQRVEADFSEWYWGVPAQAIVTLLDRYAAEGWTVAHVSEDRGVYTGADVLDESYITRIRYLLIRS